MSLPAREIPEQAIPRSAPPRGRLLQILGVSFGIAALIGGTIVVGILRTPGEVAARLPNPVLFLGLWLLGGVYALLATLSLAEPGAMIGRSGGQYVIVRRGLGEYPGFVVGWTDWLSSSGAIALGAMVITEYLEPLVPALAGRRTPAGILLVVAFGLLLWRGLRIGDLSQQILSALKALAFGVLIGLCLLLPVPAREAATHLTLPNGMALVTAGVLGLQSVIYTYDGWNSPLYFGEELRDPGRGVPRSMILGVLLVIAIYLLLNLAFVRVLGIERMAGDPFVAAAAGKALFGPRGDLVIRLLVAISILSAINAVILQAPRVLHAMSSDGLLHPALSTVNPGGTPTVAHWATVGVVCGFILTGTFDAVLALCAFFYVVCYLLSFLSVFALRRKEPETPRPFRVPGFPVTTGIVVLGSVAFLIGAVMLDWGNSWKSIVLLALSWPVYRITGRTRSFPS
jgi:basic amino acid/polyamine antiporter, APA family